MVKREREGGGGHSVGLNCSLSCVYYYNIYSFKLPVAFIFIFFPGAFVLSQSDL